MEHHNLKMKRDGNDITDDEYEFKGESEFDWLNNRLQLAKIADTVGAGTIWHWTRVEEIELKDKERERERECLENENDQMFIK